MNTPIGETERGHRRGVVLGFTMAELLLLLLFCLLLISTTSMLKKDEEIAELKQQAAVAGLPAAAIPGGGMVMAGANLQALLAMLFPGGAPPMAQAELTALWETLVLARDMQASAGSVGIETPEALEQALTVLGPMQGRFASQEELAALTSVLERLLEAGVADMSPEQVTAMIESASAPGSDGHRWPPIISLDDNKYSFDSGSAEIMPPFMDYLQTDAAKEIARLLVTYDADVIEIVGHTDERVIEPQEQLVSNLDRMALPALNAKPYDQLVPVDNAGLGLARAIEVARVLGAQEALDGVKIVPLSAGQLLRKGDQLSPGGDEGLDDPDRRRIEIRVRRSTPETN